MKDQPYEVIKATGRLPSPTGVAVELLRLANSHDATVDDIAEVVETDPATAGRLLKAANSPFMGCPYPVIAIRDVVSLLGFRMVKQLVLGFSLIQRDVENGPFDYAAFWSESLGRAVAARNIAYRLNMESPPETFTYGLLSQIGRLALATVYPKAYAMVIETVQSEEADNLKDQEHEVLGIDHDELTAAMVADWGLPSLFQKAVRHQSKPDQIATEDDAEATQLARLLNLTGRIANVLQNERVYRGDLSELTRTAHAMGLSPEVFPNIFDVIGEEWREAGSIFAINTRRVPSLAELYALAAQRHADAHHGDFAVDNTHAGV